MSKSMRSLYMIVSKMRKEAIDAYLDVYQMLENIEHDCRNDYETGTDQEQDNAWQRHKVILKVKGDILRKLEK